MLRNETLIELYGASKDLPIYKIISPQLHDPFTLKPYVIPQQPEEVSMVLMFLTWSLKDIIILGLEYTQTIFEIIKKGFWEEQSKIYPGRRLTF